MNDVLCALGHVASLQSLTSRGISSGQLRRSVTTGRIQRLRRGVYGCGHLDERIARAAAIGGALTCVSVLRAHGVWAGHSLRLHIQLPPTSSAMPDPTARFHWALPRFGLRSPGEATPLQSLWQALHCLDEENAIAAMESAMWTGFLRPEQIGQLALHAPRRLHDGIRRMVTNSGSGNETIVRLRLERAGFTVVAQGHVPGMGHQDLVVDDCVGIDVDGRAWHEGDDRFATDRDRDVQAEGLGRHSLRIRTAHIFQTWPHTLAVIERAVADARRDRERRHGRVLVGLGDPF